MTASRGATRPSLSRRSSTGAGCAATRSSRAREGTIAVADYERTIQVAFQEVSNALAGREHLAEQVAAQERGTVAQRQIAALARTRYIEGVVNFLEVLDAERNLFASEQQLLRLRRANVENLVALYVALGGGRWNGAEVDPAIATLADIPIATAPATTRRRRWRSCW